MNIREASRADAAAVARLIGELGFQVGEADVIGRLAQLAARNVPLLVADQGGAIGCASFHVMDVVHRPAPVGRISMLIVTEMARGQGIGRDLVHAAESRLRTLGCGLVEVTSNARLERAHRFYERLGFERTSLRFAKPL